MAYLNAAAGQARESGAAGLAAIADLIAASGTADGTIADVGGAFSQTTLNNNFQECKTHINLILARLRSADIILPS